MMSVAPRHRQQPQYSAAASAYADYDHHERHAHDLNAASTAAFAAAPSLPEYTQPEFRAGYDVMTSPSWRVQEGEAVLQPANFDFIHGASPTRSAYFTSATPASTSAAASATATRRANRVSLITSRSLYNIHEPETPPQPDEDEEEYNNTYKDEHRRRSSALGLDIYGNAHTDETASYEYAPTGRNSISPVSGVPSLSYSSQTSSAGHSTGCQTPTARLSFLLADAADLSRSTAPIGKASSQRDQGKLHQDQGKEKRLGKAFLGKLKSFLLSPQSPSSAKKDIKQSRTRLRRRRDQPAPVIEARSTSLYRTVDVPDPLVSPTGAIGDNRRASAFCGGPYGNLAAYGHYSQTYASAFESTASFASPPARPQHGFGYASVADFRHYSTAELPLDPTVPYSPYAHAEQDNRRFSTLFDIAAAESATEQIGHHLQTEQPASAASSGDLRLSTDKVKLKQRRGSTDWVGKSKQFWSSALDLTLPRSNKHTMSTAGPVLSQPVRAPISGPSASDLAPAVGLVPAPPIPARSRLRGTPSTLSLAGKRDSPVPSVNSTNSTTPTPRTPAPLLVSSPSDSSIGSTSSSSGSTPTSGPGCASASLPSVSSPGVPVTPGTPPVHARKQSGGWKFGSMSRSSVSGSGSGNSHGRKVSGPYSPSGPKGEFEFGDYLQSGNANAAPAQTGWPGQLQEASTSPASPLSASQKRSRFSRASRHSSSGSVSLSAASDPLRIKDGVAPRGSSSGVYTPPTFPGPSPRPSYSQHSSSYVSTATLPTMLPAPSQAFRSASGSSDASTSDSSSVSIPQTPISPSAAASRMYNACVGAFSSWSITSSSGTSSNGGKRASQPAKSVSTPYSPVHLEHGPMSANAAYFPTQPHRAPSYSASALDQQFVGEHHASRSVSYTQSQAQVPVQVWSPSTGWTEAGAQAAGLGVGVEQEGNYAQGLSRSNTSATMSKAQMITLGEAPKGRRKPVPRPQQEAEEVHAL